MLHVAQLQTLTVQASVRPHTRTKRFTASMSAVGAQEPAQQPPLPAAAPAAAGAASLRKKVKAAPAPDAERPPGKCNFFMSHKQRHCKFDVAPGKRFCGNHLFEGDGSGARRVRCPYDPKGAHMVLESELEKHKAKCPAYNHWLSERAQPFFAANINAGPADAAVEWPESLARAAGEGVEGAAGAAAGAAAGGDTAAGEGQGAEGAPAAVAGCQQLKEQRPSAMQAAYAASLGEQGFMQLLDRVEAACQQICEPEPLSVCIPAAAEPLLLPESATQNRPFSLKHAQQQASIVGNMQARGLLEGAAGVTYVEYGAGKGYLSQMLGACTPEVTKVVVMDVRGFKHKADRGMRHLELQRLRCDIKDFDVSQVSGLQGGRAPWVAVGKHLCGAATDFTLRSCARELHRQQQEVEQQAGQEQGQQQEQQQKQAQEKERAGKQKQQEEQQIRDQAGQQEGTSASVAGGGGAALISGGGSGGGVRGLAVATCCHHRCCWQHFVGQREMEELGFGAREFEVISWMTGWALCGHEVPAGFGGEGGGGEQAQQAGEQAPAPAAPQQLSQQTQQQQTQHGQKRGREEKEEGGQADAARAAAAAAAASNGPAQAHAQVQQAQQGSGAAAKPDTGPGATQAPAALCPSEAPDVVEDWEWRPQAALPRDLKIAVGQRCKRLIDAARLRWLRRQGFEACLVQYVEAGVSGENRLLLGTRGSCRPS